MIRHVLAIAGVALALAAPLPARREPESGTENHAGHHGHRTLSGECAEDG